MAKPRILLTNDDGIEAPGLRCLYQTLAPIADVVIVAPACDLTGAGMSVTLDSPMQIDSYSWEDGVVAWSVEGTPTDCVRAALHFLLDSTPDFVFSGVNWGGNAGRNALYSGTVGAALEASVHGVRGVALSTYYDRPGMTPDFSVAERFLPSLIDFLVGADYPSDVVLNVNFPSCPPDEVAGFRMARQGRGFWRIIHTELSNDEGTREVWTGGECALFDEEEESDIRLLEAGYVVAVPLALPEMTHDEMRSRHGKNFETFFS